MPFRPQPMDFAAGPARYLAPDWDAIGEVARVWVPDDETVGFLIRQGDDRLAWLSAAGPDTLGYSIRLLVDGILRAARAEDAAPAEVWAEVLDVTLHTTPQDLYLPAFLADLRHDWPAV